MYNAKNAEEAKCGKLEPDKTYDAIIVDIKDGKSKDFLPEKAQKDWDGNLDNPAINVTFEIVEDNNSIESSQIFTYIDENGKTLYAKNSNMAKYLKKYGKLPEVGDQVKVLSNNDGYGKIILK